jgi:uncharacterized protein with ParB-like and HNH nuclease domain
MNNEIKAAVKSIKRVLCDDDFFYQIPDYQRPYSWDKDNLSDLIEDLTDAFNNNSDENYFCGSLVVVENKKEDRYDVIDGQQRLTTFTIIFCVFRDFFEEKLSDKSKDFINLSIQDKYEEGKEKLKFLTSETYQNKFQQTVIKGVKERKSDSNKYLKNAYLLKNFIEERVREGRISDVNKFAEWIFEKVVLTQIICPNQDTAIQIFNVLNDRGMPLSSVDILKSTLMQKLSDEDRKIFKANWEKVKAKLEAEELSFDNLFNIYLYFLKATNPKTTLHKELLSTFKSEDSLQLIHKLENFADSYIEVRQLENNYFYCLKYLRHSIYWESILTTAKYVEYENFDELLKLLVAYYYQNWIIGATVARIKQPSFNILKALKRKATINEIKSILEKNLENYSTTDKYNEVIAQVGVYGYKWTKPVLLLLEYFSKDDSNQNFIPLDKKIEVEHILPITIEEKYGWQNVFTEEERDEYTNALGNLTLLSKRKNIQARNYAFLEKKKAYKYKDNVTTSLKLTTDVSDNEKWTSVEISKRQEKLIKELNKKLLLNHDVIPVSNILNESKEIIAVNQEEKYSAEEIDKASVKLEGNIFCIRRFSNHDIIIYDEVGNIEQGSVIKRLRKIINLHKLDVDLYHSNNGNQKNTRTLGRHVIDSLNESQLSVLEKQEEKYQLYEKNIKTNSEKKTRDKTKYVINNNGIKLSKGGFVLEFIREYLKQNPTNYRELKSIFPNEFQGSIGVINKFEEVEEKYSSQKDKRHSMKSENILKSSDNIDFVVCTQWKPDNIQNVLNLARNKGFDVKEI